MLLLLVLGMLDKTMTIIKYVLIYRFSPDRRLLVASSDNCCVDFFDVQQKQLARIGYVTHIVDPVMHMDWAMNSQYIRVNRCFLCKNFIS